MHATLAPVRPRVAPVLTRFEARLAAILAPILSSLAAIIAAIVPCVAAVLRDVAGPRVIASGGTAEVTAAIAAPVVTATRFGRRRQAEVAAAIGAPMVASAAVLAARHAVIESEVPGREGAVGVARAAAMVAPASLEARRGTEIHAACTEVLAARAEVGAPATMTLVATLFATLVGTSAMAFAATTAAFAAVTTAVAATTAAPLVAAAAALVGIGSGQGRSLRRESNRGKCQDHGKGRGAGKTEVKTRHDRSPTDVVWRTDHVGRAAAASA
jgi:hypothetical protein